MHDREPYSALDGDLRAPLDASLADPSPADPSPDDPDASAPEVYGPEGQVTRLVQAVGVDAVLAGFIAWLAWQPPERLDGPVTTVTPAATRRRCHRAVERFLRWHHCNETGDGLPGAGDGGVTAYDAALRQSGAGDAELSHTRRALALLAEYAKTAHPHWRWTP